MVNKGDKVSYGGEQWTVRDCKTIATQSGTDQQWLKLSQNEPPTRLTQTFASQLQEQQS